jgi:arginyl-tRNA synthetase
METQIRKVLEERTRAAVETAMRKGGLPHVDVPDFAVARPKNPDHGDVSVNVAMLLAKTAGMPPMKIAEALVPHLSGPEFVSVEVARPGFINFRYDAAWLAGQVDTILRLGERFGETETGAGKRVLIEYVSANPNGPLTLGHGRNGILGDVLARCFAKAGWEVEREFYVNDSQASLQMRLFAESVKARYLQLLGRGVELPEDGYKGEYIKEIAAALRERHGDGLAEGDPDETRLRFHRLAQEEMHDEQDQDMALYRLSFDHFVSEQSLHDTGAIDGAIELLKRRGHTYEKEGALFLRSSDFGDDKDRPLVRSNGQPTYIAADAAYHKDKYDRGYDLMIDVLGADHHGYAARMKAVVAAMGYDPDKLIILIYQLVRLFRGGEQVRMSTRAGDIIPLRTVLDEVGVDVARFFFLMRSHDSGLDFDLDLAKKQSDENPVYYVQYAHARICSVLRKAAEEGFSDEKHDTLLLTHPLERRLIVMLLELPEEVDSAAAELQPHRLTSYAQEMAREFHLFYDACRVLDASNPALSSARLALCRATQTVLRNCLDLIGISAPERM